MVYKYQCNIDLQDCPTLYPDGLTGTYAFGRSTVKFTNQSCVRDLRLEGNIGRCGFPGAPCITNETVSNCAGGTSCDYTFDVLSCSRIHLPRLCRDMRARNLPGVRGHLLLLLSLTLHTVLQATHATRILIAIVIFDVPSNTLPHLIISLLDRIGCNSTATVGYGVCGGSGAFLDLEDGQLGDASDGLDFGRDYCVSGQSTFSTPSLVLP